MDRFIPGAPREFARLTHLPLLAQAQVGHPTIKPRGGRRIVRKIVRALFTLLHEHLRIPGSGRMELTSSDGQRLNVTINGALTCYLHHQSRQMHGGYEPAETLLIDSLLPKISTFYDIGANWGYFTWLAATNRAFSGRIYSFEVSPRMIAELKSFLSGANFANVTLLPFGLSDQTGTVTITRERHTYLTRVTEASGAKTEQVEVRRLDELDLPPPDLIKIDVEDHELAVLKGAETLIADQRPGILFECRDPQSTTSTDLFGFLTKNGYRINVLSAADGGTFLSPVDPARIAEATTTNCNFFAAPESRLQDWFDPRPDSDYLSQPGKQA